MPMSCIKLLAGGLEMANSSHRIEKCNLHILPWIELVGRAGGSVAQWVVSSDDDALKDGLSEFLARNVPGEWMEHRQGHHLECSLVGTAVDDDTRAWAMARALTHYLLIYQERYWLDRLLESRYRTFDATECQEIVDEAVRIIHADLDQDSDRLHVATTTVFHYLLSQKAIVLEGVRTFLLGDIRLEFVEAIDQAVDGHLLDQEYREFVHLLRRLVAVSRTCQTWVHVRFESGSFFFEDSFGTRLGDDLIEDMLVGRDVGEGGLDEVLISALVTLAPHRITVHQGQITSEGRRTLLEVFEGRVLFCRGCGRCHAQVDRDRRSF